LSNENAQASDGSNPVIASDERAVGNSTRAPIPAPAEGNLPSQSSNARTHRKDLRAKRQVRGQNICQSDEEILEQMRTENLSEARQRMLSGSFKVLPYVLVMAFLSMLSLNASWHFLPEGVVTNVARAFDKAVWWVIIAVCAWLLSGVMPSMSDLASEARAALNSRDLRNLTSYIYSDIQRDISELLKLAGRFLETVPAIIDRLILDVQTIFGARHQRRARTDNLNELFEDVHSAYGRGGYTVYHTGGQYYAVVPKGTKLPYRTVTH